MEVRLKIWKSPPKPPEKSSSQRGIKPTPPKRSTRRSIYHEQMARVQTPDGYRTRGIAFGWRRFESPQGRDFFGFRELFQMFNQFHQILRFFYVYTRIPFSAKFFDDLWKFSKKKIDLSRGPSYIGKIRNTEGTKAPVQIIKLFELSSFDLSRVDSTGNDKNTM